VFSTARLDAGPGRRIPRFAGPMVGPGSTPVTVPVGSREALHGTFRGPCSEGKSGSGPRAPCGRRDGHRPGAAAPRLVEIVPDVLRRRPLTRR
jgi:hypothetical protein